jgi:hypothetical protein
MATTTAAATTATKSTTATVQTAVSTAMAQQQTAGARATTVTVAADTKVRVQMSLTPNDWGCHSRCTGAQSSGGSTPVTISVHWPLDCCS